MTKILIRFPMTPNDDRACAVLTAKHNGIAVNLQTGDAKI